MRQASGRIESGTGVVRLARPGKGFEGFRTQAKAIADARMKAGGKGMTADQLVAIIEGRVQIYS